MKKQKKKVHHSRPHGGGVPHAAVLAKERLIRESVQQAANNAVLEVEAEIWTQRQMWLMVCSIADAFHIGKTRMPEFFKAYQANWEDHSRIMEADGQDVADEKLRRRAEQVSGITIRHIHDGETTEGAGVAKLFAAVSKE